MATWQRGPEVPFGEEVQRVQLQSDPIVRVLSQVRYTPVLRVRDAEFVADFQDAIMSTYPIVEREHQQQVVAGRSGQLELSNQEVLWKFRDPSEEWQVTLGVDFVALETSNYLRREDFLDRLTSIVSAVAEHVRPTLVTRVGTRYTDRLAGTDLENITQLVRGELLGLGGATELGSGQIVGQLTQADFNVGSLELKTRWGFLPKSTTHDPSLAGIPEASWILDLDAYSATQAVFNAETCIELFKEESATIYRFFRWVVSDQFLELNGAQDE